MTTFAAVPSLRFFSRAAAHVLTGFVLAALTACSSGDSNITSIVKSEGGNSDPVLNGELSLVAGSIGGRGNLDGVGAAARFNTPSGIARDAAGNLFIADMSNYTIRKIAPDGTVSTFAGKAGMRGVTDGQGTDARFVLPTHVAVDSAGNVFVVDAGDMYTGLQSWISSQTVRKITPNGTVSTVFGTSYAVSLPLSGPVPASRATWLGGITIDTSDNLYVFGWEPIYGGFEQQLLEHRPSILKITPQGNVSTYGSLDAHHTGFDGERIVVDKNTNLYIKVAEKIIRKISPTGVLTDIDIPLDPQEYFSLSIIGVDSNDNVYLLNANDRYTLLKLDPSGKVSTVLSSARANLPFSVDDVFPFNSPTGLVPDPENNLYVSDSWGTILKIGSTGTIATIAGALSAVGNQDGIGSAARFGYNTVGLAAVAGNNLYAIDYGNRSVRKITASGEVSTVVASASSAPTSVALDAAGNLYVAHRTWVTGVIVGDFIQSRIDRISTTGQVTTFAGSPDVNLPGSVGSADGTGTDARFWDPRGLAFDKSGNLYVSDSRNYTIRKITPQGVVTTLAGKAGESGKLDGSGNAARFSGPDEIRIDQAGNLLVLDFDFPVDQGGKPPDTAPVKVRKISPDGVVTTVGVANNLMERAKLRGLSNVGPSVADGAGNIYVAESTDHTIRKITPSGAVTVVAGGANEKGIRLGALPGRLDSPNSLAFVAPNTLFVTSGGSVLKLTLPK